MTVATAPGQRRKGYAEAAIRLALAQSAAATGLHRTALDASPVRQPLYAQMGCTATAAA